MMLRVAINKKLNHYTLDVNFTVQDEILVLFGASGSGKTTILNIIAGITNPDHGHIMLNDKVFYHDHHVKALPVQKRKTGYLFQDYALFPHLTVEKNILYGSKGNVSKHHALFIKQLLRVMGIEHLLEKYPRQISGGEKQRVALARALAIEPELLLLDEPFSALDGNTRNECHLELLRLHKMWKIPVILVTHDLEEAKRLGDRILFIDNGKLVNQPPYDLTPSFSSLKGFNHQLMPNISFR